MHNIVIGLLLTGLLFACFSTYAISQVKDAKQQKELLGLFIVVLFFFGSMFMF